MFKIPKIFYIERTTGERKEEKVYGEAPLAFLYSRWGAPLRYLITRFSLFSKAYGYLQSRSSSRKKVKPFIKYYEIDTSEFQKKDFSSFNDFFMRKIKPRKLAPSEAIIPADGRYRFFANLKKSDGYDVKGQKFSLEGLLQDVSLAKEYEEGSMVIARLAPVDYHRFHFPCDGVPQEAKLIKGRLDSVNPLPLQKNIHIFSQNKRMVTPFDTDPFGKVLIIEVGATCVGTIHQTYTPHHHVQKGDEKGTFSFGGSAIILLFKPGTIAFDPNLFHSIEVRCLMGQSMGKCRSAPHPHSQPD